MDLHTPLQSELMLLLRSQKVLLNATLQEPGVCSTSTLLVPSNLILRQSDADRNTPSKQVTSAIHGCHLCSKQGIDVSMRRARQWQPEIPSLKLLRTKPLSLNEIKLAPATYSAGLRAQLSCLVLEQTESKLAEHKSKSLVECILMDLQPCML